MAAGRAVLYPALAFLIYLGARLFPAIGDLTEGGQAVLGIVIVGVPSLRAALSAGTL
jgi:hypothetical protein